MGILRVSGLRKDFSGLKVLTGVEFEVGQREKLAIIGPNGAGKTTLFNIISGKFPPSSGEVVFKDEAINPLTPYARARRGRLAPCGKTATSKFSARNSLSVNPLRFHEPNNPMAHNPF